MLFAYRLDFKAVPNEVACDLHRLDRTKSAQDRFKAAPKEIEHYLQIMV